MAKPPFKTASAEKIMDFLDFFAIFVLLVIAAVCVAAAFFLGKMPGDIARRRGHPQADAITACGWLGLLTGVLWPIALVWAYSHPTSTGTSAKGSTPAAI